MKKSVFVVETNNRLRLMMRTQPHRKNWYRVTLLSMVSVPTVQVCQPWRC